MDSFFHINFREVIEAELHIRFLVHLGRACKMLGI
jgi:hypothetical protein